MGWWHRLRGLSDGRRARLLAYVLGALILLFVYALGGVSLYVRERYLASDAVRALQLPYWGGGELAGPAGEEDQAASEDGLAAATPRPSLLPTRTPQPGHGSQLPSGMENALGLGTDV